MFVRKVCEALIRIIGKNKRKDRGSDPSEKIELFRLSFAY
ncbi:MAG: hypothetical protein K0Q51_744 [Rickettsiaceae bacterium]|jgi:hypothetical protein|nr:hypothetical protein [Rickettsiaceae bacterium]